MCSVVGVCMCMCMCSVVGVCMCMCMCSVVGVCSRCVDSSLAKSTNRYCGSWTRLHTDRLTVQ